MMKGMNLISLNYFLQCFWLWNTGHIDTPKCSMLESDLKLITSKCLWRFFWYLTSDTRRGFLSLFFPLFQEHSWLVQGFNKVGPCFLMWSRIENRTATTWLQRPKDEALHGSHEACMTAPLFTDKTTTTLCGRSVFVDGQTCARTK